MHDNIYVHFDVKISDLIADISLLTLGMESKYIFLSVPLTRLIVLISLWPLMSIDRVTWPLASATELDITHKPRNC